MSSPLGFPAPVTYTAGLQSPFDLPGITAAIDLAVATLKPDERGSVTVQLDQGGFGAGLVVRGPFRTSVLAKVTRPMAGRWGWALSGRVAFLAGGGAESAKLVRVAPEVRGLYRLFRKLGHGRIVSAARAVRVAQGAEVRIAR